MPKRPPYADVHLDVTAGEERWPQAPDSETPFSLVILGDFTGRANRGRLETGRGLAGRAPLLLDRDNFDAVLEKLSPQLVLPLESEGGLKLTLEFKDLDDFHPDRLFEKAVLFRKLREVRQRLDNPDTFRETAAELGLAAEPRPEPPRREPPHRIDAVDVERITSGSLLDEMIESTEQRASAAPARARDEWTILLNKMVAPHLVARADPRQAEVVGLIDRATSAQMRALLHANAFQQLEAAWRAVFFLVRNLETSSQLKVYLLDVSKQELAADLGSAENLASTATYKLLAEKAAGTFGAERRTLIAGNFTFEPTREDTGLLRRLGRICAAAGAPFVAAASPRFLGCDSVQKLSEPETWRGLPEEYQESWQALRASPEAKYLGLALPRFLLRLPYGKETEATERFQFEECSDPADHEEYLWGNPAFACALLLGQTFAEQGWAMRPGSRSDLSGLPFYTYKAQGESKTLPCAEVLMTVSGAEKILEKGLMPLASLKDQTAVRLVRFQSVADPLTPLAGCWEA